MALKETYIDDRLVAIGKQELYPRVYRKYWDLRQYENLENYGLYPAIYNYIGYSNEKLQSTRHSKWLSKIRKQYKVNPNIPKFFNNLERFYREELNYSEMEIKQNLKPVEEILCRCETVEEAKKMEKVFTGHYHFLAFLNPNYILLSDKDSSCKTINNNNGCQILKVKKLKKFK